MRIIAGEFRSRNLKTLEGDTTRPTSDKVKGALFSSIQNCFLQENILDVFGGSGAITLEALSRGASSADIIEIDRKAVEVIKDNVEMLSLQDRVYIHHCSYKDGLEKLKDKRYALIYIDPPYKLEVIGEILDFIDIHEMLLPYGILVVENDVKNEFKDTYKSFIKQKVKQYRYTALTYYKGVSQ